jgi:hypothetical protein
VLAGGIVAVPGEQADRRLPQRESRNVGLLAVDVGVGALILLKVAQPVQCRPIVQCQLAEVRLNARRIGKPLTLGKRKQLRHVHPDDGVRIDAAEFRRDLRPPVVADSAIPAVAGGLPELAGCSSGRLSLL